MDQLSRKKLDQLYEAALNYLREEASMHIWMALSDAPEMTPIEQMAYPALLVLVLLERMCGVTADIVPQFQIGRHRVDFMLQAGNEKFVIECDGHDFHERTKEQAANDKQRDREIQAAGFKVFRVTGSEIWRGREWLDDIASELMAISHRAWKRKNEK